MKMAFPSLTANGESAVRPGFDVFLAVTGARQAASPTARRVAAIRSDAADMGGDDQRRALLARGQLPATGTASAPALAAARFADVTPVAAGRQLGVEEVAMEMNGLFTRAFQPMVKHGDVNPQDTDDSLGGSAPGME